MVNQEISLLKETRKPRFFYGYVVVMASFIIQGVAFGIFASFGIFFTPLLIEFGWSRATISGASSLGFVVNGLACIIVGGLSDRFGPRIFMAICGFVFGLGYLLMSQVNTIWQLYLFYGVIVGIGVSGTDVILLSTVARWFVKTRGIMSGIVKAGTGVGMLIMPLLVSRLISAYTWRTSYIILGTLALVVIISFAQLLLRGPSQMRQLPVGEEKTTTGNLDLAEGGLSLQQAIHTRQFWTICATYLAIIFCAQTIMVHIAPHVIDLRISATNAAVVLSIIGGASIAGRLVMGNAGDRIGNKQAIIVCFLILVATLSWLQLAKELWMFYLFGAVYGFTHGGFFAIMSPLVAELFGTRSQGVILGAVIFSGTVGGAIGPLLAGHIFDIMGSYQTAFLVCLAVSVVGLMSILLLRLASSKGGTNGS